MVALAAGLGAGLGIPLLIALGALIWLLRRRSHRKEHAQTDSAPDTRQPDYPMPSARQEMAQPPNKSTPPAPSAQPRFQRRPVGGQTTVSPYQSVVSPVNSRTSPSRGFEVPGQDARTELSDQVATPELGPGARAATKSPGPPPYTSRSPQEAPHQVSGPGSWVWQAHGSAMGAGRTQTRSELQ
jgi:hypothetical protein